MNLQEAYNFLNFYINKNLGYYYTPAELDAVVHRAQIGLYNDYYPKYATSQRIKDALAPFRQTYKFGYNDTLNGLVTIPSNQNYSDFLEMYIAYDISGRVINKQVSIELVNEDQRSIKLNSQISPVVAIFPIGEMVGVGVVQLYPQVQYRGAVTFLSVPRKPQFVYTTISQRVIVYDPANSIQLQWNEPQTNEILIKGLQTLGINVSSQEIVQFSETKSTENYMGRNHS